MTRFHKGLVASGAACAAVTCLVVLQMPAQSAESDPVAATVAALPTFENIEPPAPISKMFAGQDALDRRTGKPTVQVLGKMRHGKGHIVAVAGPRSAGGFCFSEYKDAEPTEANMACTDATAIPTVFREAAEGVPGRISGFAPAGARNIRLVAADRPEVVVPAHPAGSTVRGRSYFMAEWPIDIATTITAFNGGGKVLDEVDSGSMPKVD